MDQTGVRFEIEPLHRLKDELPPLFERHHRDLGRNKDSVPLDPHWDMMMQLSAMSFLQILAARAPNGELIGYMFNLVGPHMHYRTTLHATVDMFWLDPEFRRGLTGCKMLRANENEMRKLGVVRYMISQNLIFDRRMRLLFNRLGYVACDIHYAKVL